MPSINLDVDYFEHFKTKRLVIKLGEGAEIIPVRLWILAARFYCEKGLFKNVEDQELVSLAGIKCNKDATSILQACVEIGFLDKTKNGYQIHEWEEYQGHIIAYKIRGKHAAQKRWGKLKPGINEAEVQKVDDKTAEENWNS